jgi:hypothetical protein
MQSGVRKVLLKTSKEHNILLKEVTLLKNDKIRLSLVVICACFWLKNFMDCL